jgi:hypothetical protein
LYQALDQYRNFSDQREELLQRQEELVKVCARVQRLHVVIGLQDEEAIGQLIETLDRFVDFRASLFLKLGVYV